MSQIHRIQAIINCCLAKFHGNFVFAANIHSTTYKICINHRQMVQHNVSAHLLISTVHPIRAEIAVHSRYNLEYTWVPRDRFLMHLNRVTGIEAI